MTLQDEQIEREKQSVTRGIERLRSQLEADEAAGRTFENAVGQAMARRLVERAVDNVGQLQRNAKKAVREGQTTGRRLAGWELPVMALDVDTLAFIAVRTMCNSVGRGVRETQVARVIGDMVNLQVRWVQLRDAERARAKEPEADPAYNRISYLKREVKAINPRSLKKWLKKLDDLYTEEWDQRTRVAVGSQLIQAIMEECPDIFERETVVQRKGRVVTKMVKLKFTTEAMEHLERRLRGMGTNTPWLLPMICPPKPWTPDELGGYLIIPRDFVKGLAEEVYEEVVPQVVIDAVNLMQNTGWKVNQRVLAVAKGAVERKLAEVLPVDPVRALPPEVDKDTWAGMSDEERAEVKVRRREVHDNNFRLESKRLVIQRQFEIAEDLGDREFYFPHNLDFRGRAYPLPQDLHPQCDDFGKALLTFSEAKPLGQSGFLWLQYHVANTYGMDKLTRDEQLNWCFQNIESIRKVALTPFDALDFWSEAEEPWQFLAAAIELTRAMDHGGDDYLCSLPIHVDGSCNGLQHLSAMGRDPVGAEAVNLCSGPRQDIYQIVADKVARRVEVDAARCEDERWYDQPACKWNGKVTRKVVKRGVMTKPYGLTHVGMRDQLIDDRHKCWPEVEGDIRDNATYMRDLMAEAIEDTVKASVVIMDWMQDCAKALAHEGLGIRWTAPTGFQVNQYYPNLGSRIYTVVGVGIRSHQRKVSVSETLPGLRQTKQVQAIAPNIVHSFDAAHMQLAIVASGLTSVSAVHDSFGCHACDMDGFLGTIKDTFIMIYTPSVLNQLYVEFLAQAPEGVEIPEPPAVGDFDIAEVAKSDFFFA